MDNQKNNTTNVSQAKRELFEESFLKILAVLLALVISFCVVKIAYSNARDKITIAKENPTQSQNVGNESQDSFSNDVTNASDGPVNTESNGNTVNKGEMSTDEIVALYNVSVNKVKSESTSLTRNYKKSSSVDEYFKLPSSIESIGKSAMNTFVKDDNEPQTWTDKNDIKIIFPVGGEDYSSKLTLQMVKSAKCEDKDSTYEVQIVLKDDSIVSPKKGEGYAGVFNTVTASTFDGLNIPTVTFNSVDISGINGSIVCTIDKSSKQVTKINFKNTDILKMNVKVVVSTMDAQFALATEEDYSINY